MEGWKEFMDSGMLWWVNRILHTFGWTIFIHMDEHGNVTKAYPERTTWLGFPPEADEECFRRFRGEISQR